MQSLPMIMGDGGEKYYPSLVIDIEGEEWAVITGIDTSDLVLMCVTESGERIQIDASSHPCEVGDRYHNILQLGPARRDEVFALIKKHFPGE